LSPQRLRAARGAEADIVFGKALSSICRPDYPIGKRDGFSRIKFFNKIAKLADQAAPISFEDVQE
jgi:hypothetical protein